MMDNKHLKKSYIRIYDKINSGELSQKEVLSIQEKIFDMIEKISEENRILALPKNEIISMLRMLVNNIVWRYAIPLDFCHIHSLTNHMKSSNNYSSHNIRLYFDVAKEHIKAFPEDFIIINDLCEGGIGPGDFVFKNKERTLFYEYKKSSEKNDLMMELVHSGEDYKFENTNDQKQFERLKRQKELSEEIIDSLYISDSACELYNTSLNLYDNGFTFSYFDDVEIITYRENLIDAVKNINSKNQFEFLHIDDAIQVIIFKIGLSNDYTYFDVREDNIDVVHYDYREVIINPYLPQTYNSKLGSEMRGKDVYMIAKGALHIDIVVNYEVLFQRFRKAGYKIYPKKNGLEMTHKDHLFYKNRWWVIEKNGIKWNVSNTLAYRLVCAFYTSEDCLIFLKNVFSTIAMIKNTDSYDNADN